MKLGQLILVYIAVCILYKQNVQRKICWKGIQETSSRLLFSLGKSPET